MPERVCRSLFAMIYQISQCIKIRRRHILLRNNQLSCYGIISSVGREKDR